ncbi:MAG: hypothetical protein IJZ81_01515 [Clostridia bacterium]|nr:hypothetical protein [Clostridia bacterium]
MNEKTKKYLVITAYQALAALGIFLVLFVIDKLAPRITDKLGVIWSKNTDLKRTAQLMRAFMKELLPF